METVTLTKERLLVHAKLSRELISEIKLNIGRDGDDFFKEMFTAQLEATLVKASEESQEITVYRKPQKFFDWILRKDQEFTFQINRKEFMRNPPVLKDGGGVMIYNTNEIESA